MGAAEVAGAWPMAGQSFTADELDGMPADGRRYEVLDGTLVVSPRPGAAQQVVAARLAGALLAACPDSMFVIPGPIVRLSRTTAFVPDLAVTRQLQSRGGTLTEAPLLVIEIRTPGTAPIDPDRKKAAYQAFGVRSYWIVVPDTREPQLHAFAAAGGHYEQTAHVRSGEVFRSRQPFPVELVPARLVTGLPSAQPSYPGISVTAERPEARHLDRQRKTGDC